MARGESEHNNQRFKWRAACYTRGLHLRESESGRPFNLARNTPRHGQHRARGKRGLWLVVGLHRVTHASRSSFGSPSCPESKADSTALASQVPYSRDLQDVGAADDDGRSGWDFRPPAPSTDLMLGTRQRRRRTATEDDYLPFRYSASSRDAKPGFTSVIGTPPNSGQYT